MCKICGAAMAKADDFAGNDISGDVCKQCWILGSGKKDSGSDKETQFLKAFLMRYASFSEQQASQIAAVYSRQRATFKEYLIRQRGFTEKQAEEFIKRWASFRDSVLKSMSGRKQD